MPDLQEMNLTQLRAEAERLGFKGKFGTKEKGREVVRNARRAAARTKPGSPGTIRELAEQLLREPLPYTEVLAKVKERFPNAGTSRSSLRWYTVQMRKRGEELPARPFDSASRHAA
jgi:hypothetical protein